MILPFGSHHTVHYRDDLPQCVDNYPNCLKDSVHAANVVQNTEQNRRHWTRDTRSSSRTATSYRAL